jgi:hypothetical protein
MTIHTGASLCTRVVRENGPRRRKQGRPEDGAEGRRTVQRVGRPRGGRTRCSTPRPRVPTRDPRCHRQCDTGAHRVPTGTGHRRTPGTDAHRAPTHTGHQRTPGTDAHRAPTHTGHQRTPGTNAHRAPTHTGHRVAQHGGCPGTGACRWAGGQPGARECGEASGPRAGGPRAGPATPWTAPRSPVLPWDHQPERTRPGITAVTKMLAAHVTAATPPRSPARGWSTSRCPRARGSSQPRTSTTARSPTAS